MKIDKFNIKETVKKIQYYIKNKFELDPKLRIFYKNLNLKTYNNTYNFINYLIKLK